jgi:putative transposase
LAWRRKPRVKPMAQSTQVPPGLRRHRGDSSQAGAIEVSYWRLFYHLIWATKDRQPTIDDGVRSILDRSFQSIADELGLIPHAVFFMPDHVHLAISIPPRHAVSDVAKRFKGASSYAVNASHRIQRANSFRWQPEFGVVSFDEDSLHRVIDYITDQIRHHAAGTCWPTFEISERTPA